jgi:hypothetical protein
MSKTIQWLAVLLGVQIVMAIGLHRPILWPAVQPGAAPLVAVTLDQINRIVLEGPDHANVVLVKEGGLWLLPELDKFPADSNRVATLLERVTGSKTGPPIATTAGAKTRFKVSDDAFERRITFAQNATTLATLYVGSSPGPRRSYVRAGGDDTVYALELAPYELPVRLADWEDKTILQFPKHDIAALDVAGLRLEPSTQPAAASSSGKQVDTRPATTPSPLGWEIKGPEAGRQPELKSDAVDKLVALLADLTFDNVLGRTGLREYGLEKPLLTITLTRKTGQTVTYILGKNLKSDDYTLKVSTRPEYFRLPSYRATAFLEAADRKQLLGAAADKPAPPKT